MPERTDWNLHALSSSVARPGVGLWVARVAAGERPSAFPLGRCVADEFEVRALAVDSRVRRRGAASAHLEVRARNGAARALYDRAGFAIAGTRRGFYPDGDDAIRLSRPLAEGG